MKDLYRKITDVFFYDNYSLVWKGAKPEEMADIYVAEMDSLIDCLEEGRDYYQEFAKDYPLIYKLRILVDGKYQVPQQKKSDYAILPSKGLVFFKKAKEIVYQCSYQRFFQILMFYIQSLQEKFPRETAQKEWFSQLKKLKRGRLKSQFASMVDKLCFWNNTIGNPDTHFEGSKELNLDAKNIASFQQLKCRDTLRSLNVHGAIKVRDFDVLKEYTQLETLYLPDMGISDISFLASMKNLKELGLGGNQIKDLAPLAGLKKLESLYIARNPIQDFSVVRDLPALRILFADLEQLPDQLAWDTIPKRISLRVLQMTLLEGDKFDIETIYSRPIFPSENDLTQKTTDPRKLNVKDRWLYSGLINALGYQPAVKYDITKLKQLDCSDHILLCDHFLFLNEIGDYSCLESAVNLRKLNLSGRVVKDWSWLCKCVNLRELNLAETDFSDLGLLVQMKQLTSLNLSGCHNLKEDSLLLLKQLPKLKKLDLSNTH
ncbi:MAG: leucine-rich repeat domain-containing protein [Lachnospiraceae bacterium]|nr:leucine-rich repeat domain-containing protein [Lachnospiraceae bacterium]